MVAGYTIWPHQVCKQSLAFCHSASVCAHISYMISPWPHCALICWTLYVAVGTFVVEQRHGFNKQTPLLFFKDQIKTVSLRSCTSVVPLQFSSKRAPSGAFGGC